MSSLFSTAGKESRMKMEDVEELPPPKVRSDSIKIDLLEAENRRLKKFEEANGRLRKYNWELRHALIKAQGLDPLIQIPDDRGDTLLFSNEPVEEVSQTLQSCDAVVFNAIIMDQVFKNLDVMTLKKCRLVCANWNEKVSLILSRQNSGYGLAVCLEGRYLALTEASQLTTTIQDIRSTIASAPQHWFSKALLDKSFAMKTDTQSVLVEFGYCLKSIEVTGPNFLFRDIHRILVDWCPNLEQLALPRVLVVQDEKNAPGPKELKKGYRKLVFTRPLKLTGLFMEEQLCISIVKASPNLKTLNLSCNSDKYSLQFFKELLNCPEITRNLENMKLYTGCSVERISEKMKTLNSIQFSSKLKKLEVDAVGDFRANELSEALEKLQWSLEKLVLNLKNDMKPELVFPGMNNLTELRYLTVAAIPINSIEFLTGMPNLKTLYLGENDFGIMEEEYFIDNWFSDCEKLRRNPRTKLKVLNLFGVVQCPLPTFEMMNTIFPNLTKLVVGIFVLCHWDDEEELKKYYTSVLDGGLSKMTSLIDLYLDFKRPQPNVEEDFDYMAFIFKQLDKLSSLSDLKYLTVRDNSNSTTELVGDKLVKIPNLRRLTFIGLKLDWVTAKELTILLYKHDIRIFESFSKKN